MNKDDLRWNDIRVTVGSGNVFLDLGFKLAEAEIMALRAEVIIRVGQRLSRLRRHSHADVGDG